MTAALDNPIFHNADKAREALEATRWPNGPVCPHCKATDDRVVKVEGSKKSHRPGLYYCNDCRGQFTVTVGTVFEDSKVPLNKWWMAVYLMSSSKKGISSHQLHRMLGVSYKTAWFMTHRIREAMRSGDLGPMGGGGGTVEADETFIGMEEGKKKRQGTSHKLKVLALVERNGMVRSFHIEELTKREIGSIVYENISREAHFRTDEAQHYRKLGKVFASHDVVNHSKKEYVRGDVHTNTIEGVFSIFKRGMKGVYQHCGRHHLHRYLAEFDFRYNNRIALGVNDTERTTNAMKGIEGKRLTYRRTDEARL